MKHNAIINAYNTLRAIAGEKLGFKTSYKLYCLIKKLEPTYLFRVEEEKKLFENYGATVTEDGRLKFKDHETEVLFTRALEELSELDADVEIEPVKLPLSAFEGTALSMADIARLEGFVEFEEE